MPRSSFGNVRRTPSGRYQPRYTAPDGTPRTLGKTYRTKREAESALAAVRVEMDRGAWIDPKAPDPSEPARTPTLGDYVEHFHLARAGKRGGSVKHSTRALAESELRDYILPTFGDTPLDRITLSAVREWYGRLQDPEHTPHRWKRDEDGRPTAVSPSLVRQCYSLLKAILNMAVSEELIDSNPCRIRGASQNRYAKPDYMSQADARSIIAQLDGDTAVLAALALATACRLGELLALTWADVNLGARLIHIRRAAVEVNGRQVLTTTKTEEARDIDLDEPTVSLLRFHHLSRLCEPTDRLFLAPSGAPLRHRQVQARWRRAREGVGVSFRFHHLRHTALTKLAYDGRPIQEIMERAGHASFVAAMNYQRLAPKAKRIEGTPAD